MSIETKEQVYSHALREWVDAQGNSLGYRVAIDFLTQMALEEKVFNVYGGNISVPFVGGADITDTEAEISIDGTARTVLLPVYCNINFNLAGETLFETAGKSVGAVSTGGDAFVPLNLSLGGPGPTFSARADETGGVTVAAEVTTTTRRHFAWGHPIIAGAWETVYDWEPRSPPRINGAACFYVQIAADTTGPSYFASLDVVELVEDKVS